MDDGEKWRIRKLFQEFFDEVSLRKHHLEAIEHNYKEEIRDLFRSFKASIEEKRNIKDTEISQSIDALENSVTARIDSLEKRFEKVNFWVGSVKWLLIASFPVILAAFLAWLGKRTGAF